ncbi:MAG: gala protein, partial [Polyangiales bacterium]
MSNRTHVHVTPSFDRDAFAPLLRHLESGQAVTERTVFPRGTMLPDGRLDLCKQGVGIEGAVLVARSLRFHRFVSSLLLGADELQNDGARAIAGLVESNESLTTVFLGCNLIDREGASSLAGAVSGHPTLRGLWVKRNPLGREGVRVLANAARDARALRTIDLAQVELDDGEAALSP